MSNKIEVFSTGQIEAYAKADSGKSIIKGYACKWEVYSALMYDFFYTIFDRHMLDGVLEKPEIDCKANVNHNNNLILARYYPSKGVKTLSLSIDDTGLLFEFEVPDTTLGRDTFENIKNGNIVGCSMAVSVQESEWTGTHNGKDVRRLILCDDLLDVCVTPDPAFPVTEVEASKYSNLVTKQDYLLMQKEARKAPEQNGRPKSYFQNKLRLLEVDKK